MKINPHETNQIALRKMCRHLPAPTIPSRSRNGRNTKQWLKADQIRFLIQRQLSEQKVKTSDKHRVASKKDPDLVAHAFWISVMPGDTASIAEQGRLTPICALGLHSALAVGFNVSLWSYHDTFDLPPLLQEHPQLQIRDAREHLSEDKFMDMLHRKWSLGNIADVVRYRSAKTDNLHRGAWVIDLDTWWLRQPTAANSPSSTGHIMATCAARNRRANDNLHWKFMYLSKPEERTHMLPPVYFPRGSVVLQEIQNTCVTLARRQKCIQRCRATST